MSQIVLNIPSKSLLALDAPISIVNSEKLVQAFRFGKGEESSGFVRSLLKQILNLFRKPEQNLATELMYKIGTQFKESENLDHTQEYRDGIKTVALANLTTLRGLVNNGTTTEFDELIHTLLPNITIDQYGDINEVAPQPKPFQPIIPRQPITKNTNDIGHYLPERFSHEPGMIATRLKFIPDYSDTAAAKTTDQNPGSPASTPKAYSNIPLPSTQDSEEHAMGTLHGVNPFNEPELVIKQAELRLKEQSEVRFNRPQSTGISQTPAKSRIDSVFGFIQKFFSR